MIRRIINAAELFCLFFLDDALVSNNNRKSGDVLCTECLAYKINIS